ncbi:MAG: NADPH-dependent glutamate synthase [Clostridiales bacterium]|nr:NADPH-dependent glutamate synthase [Clostridiales bacterium]
MADQGRHPMPLRDAETRRRTFDEVALGYTAEMARAEAARCLHCKNSPCMQGCPVHIDIPAFLQAVRQGNDGSAYDVISRASSLPAVCGRVCPQENQCEKQCVRGLKGEPVAIGRVERYVADRMLEKDEPLTPPASNGIRAAVVGSGPAGLTCAGELRRRGYEVTVFEALHTAGGVLVYGIPEFRLPKKIVRAEVEKLRKMGVDVQTDMVIGRTMTIQELFEQGYRSVFIGTGAGLPRFMGIPGENLRGVYSANEFLTRVNLMKAYREDSDTPVRRGRRVAVVGGGNVAMDAARCALRLGAEEVSIIYRRSGAEMPARREEVEHAREEGVIFRMLTNPQAILGQEDVQAIRCVQMVLGEPDASGRRRPVEVEGSQFELSVDCVIVAIGTSPNPLISATTEGLETNRTGCIVTRDEGGETSLENVYAGGDAVTGAATVILAMGAGKAAARKMDEKMRGGL